MTPVTMVFAKMAVAGKTPHEMSREINVMHQTKRRSRWVSNIGSKRRLRWVSNRCWRFLALLKLRERGLAKIDDTRSKGKYRRGGRDDTCGHGLSTSPVRVKTPTTTSILIYRNLSSSPFPFLGAMYLHLSVTYDTW